MNTIKTTLIAILFPISSFAQYKYKVTRCNSHVYIRNEWKQFQENYPTKMFLTIDGSSFKINNEDHSVYTLYGEVKKEDYTNRTTYTWDAYDKDHQDCIAVLTQGISDSSTFSFTVFYEKECFNWELTDIN
jgi:hypothetical protein